MGSIINIEQANLVFLSQALLDVDSKFEIIVIRGKLNFFGLYEFNMVALIIYS